MYQNIPLSIIDEPLASEAFAMTTERRAAVQDEINAWGRYARPGLQQFGGSESVHSVGQGSFGPATPSAMGRHESAHMASSSDERAGNMRRVPKDIGASELREPRLRFEGKPFHRQAMSGAELKMRASGFREVSSPISEPIHDIDFPLLFGSDPLIDGPLLPNAKIRLKNRHDLKGGGYTVSNSIFYLPCPPQIDSMRSIGPVEGCPPPFPGRKLALTSTTFKNVLSDFSISAFLEGNSRE